VKGDSLHGESGASRGTHMHTQCRARLQTPRKQDSRSRGGAKSVPQSDGMKLQSIPCFSLGVTTTAGRTPSARGGVCSGLQGENIGYCTVRKHSRSPGAGEKKFQEQPRVWIDGMSQTMKLPTPSREKIRCARRSNRA
jgi:hypothetical protein